MITTPFARLLLLALGLALPAAARAVDTAATVQPPPTPGIGTSPADAAPEHPRRGHGGFVLAELTEKLGLTADQQKTVAGIIASNRSQAKELRSDESLSKADRHQKMLAVREATRGRIRAALTPAQQKLFDALPANANAGGPPPAPPAP